MAVVIWTALEHPSFNFSHSFSFPLALITFNFATHFLVFGLLRQFLACLGTLPQLLFRPIIS